MEYADSSVNYAEKYCMKLASRCQFHKTFFGVIYAPSGVTLVKTSWNMADSGINFAKKYCMKLASRCQIHKTFSGVIYAPSGITLIKT